MRKCFVANDGKKQLVVNAASGEYYVDNWSKIISTFSDLINENTLG